MAISNKPVRSDLRVSQKHTPAPMMHVPARPASRAAARAVGTYVPKLTRKAFEKYGFSTVALLTDWVRIVGTDLARATVPERIRWPRAYEGDSDAERRVGAGATLHLRVDPSRALDIQYKSGLLIDRINAHFGYRAVADLRILQAPVAAAAARANVGGTEAGTPVAPSDPALATIPDDGLRQALARMQAGLLTRSR